MRFLLAVLAACLALPASAQDRVPQGIGFAVSEHGAWLCRHEEPFEALSCAREHCGEEDPGGTCAPAAWCYPAGWSGVLLLRKATPERRILCGMTDEATLTAMATTLCASNKEATGCDLTLIVDPEGFEKKVEGVSFPGGAPPEAEAPADATPADTPPDNAPADDMPPADAAAPETDE